MADFPEAPRTAPASGPAAGSNANGSLIDATKTNAAAAYNSLASGPVAQNVLDQSQKTSHEFSNLAAARKTPNSPAATGQPLTHYHSFFAELLSWNNPRASAIAYGAAVTLILAARYLDIIRWGFKLTWMVLGTTILAEVAGKLVLNNGLATQLRPRRYYMVSRETLDAGIGDVHELVNFFVIESQRILFAENVGASAAAFIAAFISYYLVKIVPYWGLSLIFTTLAFMVPLLYTSNQELIDTQLKQAGDVINTQTAQLRNVASKSTAQATNITKQYVGDYTAKAQEMLRGRSVSPSNTTKTAKVNSTDFPTAPKTTSTDFPTAPTTTFTKPEPVVPEKEPLLT